MSAERAKRVVVDASIVVDLFAGRDRARVEAAERFFSCLEAMGGQVKVFAPRLFLVEVSGVLVRFLEPRRVRSIVQRLEREFLLVSEDLYFRESVEIALRTGSRGADSYYIGLAGLLDAVLVTSDRVQALNAKRAGIQAYYAPKDLSEALQHLGCTVDAGQHSRSR